MTRSSSHPRPHSWPPFRVQTGHSGNEIDGDPFRFFVSQPDAVPNDRLTAGIGDDHRSRSLSPRIWRARDNRLSDSTATNSIAKLKKWIERMEKLLFHRPDAHSLAATTPIKLTPTPRGSLDATQTRGRGSYRTAPRNHAPRGVRSHSGRPRSWLEPAEELWSLPEEQEELGLGISIPSKQP